MAETARLPCRLLTEDDLQSVLGVKFNAGVPHVGTPPIAVIGMQHCLFSSKVVGGRSGPSVYIGLASAFPQEVFDKYKNAVGPSLQPVASLGNEAVYSEFGITSNLVALSKKKVIGVSLSFVQKDAKQVAETLAKRALERA